MSLIVDTRREFCERGSEGEASLCSTIVDILRDLPEVSDEELARVEDLEGSRVESDSRAPSCASLLPAPERLRRDRILFTERSDAGYRSAIEEPVSRNRVHLSKTDAGEPRQQNEVKHRPGSHWDTQKRTRAFQTPITEAGFPEQPSRPHLNHPRPSPSFPLTFISPHQILRRLSYGSEQEVQRLLLLRRRTIW